MRRPSLLRVSTSDSEGPSQKQIWLFRLAKFLLVLTFVEDGLRMIVHPEGQARIALGLPSVGPSRAAGEGSTSQAPETSRHDTSRQDAADALIYAASC